MKRITCIGLFAASLLVTSCSSKPTLDRSVLEGYNNCIAAVEKAEGERAAANVSARGEALKTGKFFSEGIHFPRDCKSEYGIPSLRDITDYRIIN